MEITLLRHGKPIIPQLNKICPYEFIEWVNSYNSSGLCPSLAPPKEAYEQAINCNAIVCSELPRSIESAKALRNNITLSHSNFNEAGLPIPKWHYPKLSPKAWAVIFRVFWLLGYSNNSESLNQAKNRASKASQMLISLANEHKSVLFVGHGVYNRLLSNELRARGWLGPKNPGNKYWSFGVYKYK